jgi:CubicO group peptidase (beta-lactamase class C family)
MASTGPVALAWAPVELDRRGIDRLAARVIESGCAPAVAVAVTGRDGTLLAETYGAADRGALWPVASIGKSFTAVVALQLAAEGLLDLHAPLSGYVPWLTLRSPGEPITTHHLLTHTAGLVESSDLAPASNYDVVALAGTGTDWPPGEHRHYSNVGYRAVGVLLERLTGRPYPELVQRRVLDRLGLRDSTPAMVHETRARLPGGHVPPFDDRPWEPAHGLVPAPWVESAEADGCVCCTAGDLAAYLRALWTGSDLLPDESLATMRTPQPPHDEDDAYGYGLELHEDGFGHEGDMLGYVSYMRVDTRAGLGVVALANGIGGARWLGEGVLALVSGRDHADLDLTPDPPLVDDGSCPREWRGFTGRFRTHNPWLPTFKVAARDGRLVMGTDWTDGSERLELTPLGLADFRVGEPDWTPERLRFDTVVEGYAQRALLSGTPYYRAFTG